MAAPASPDSRALERLFGEHRGKVMRLLQADFNDVPDHEDVYQEAWTEALETLGSGSQVKDLPALLRVIAWRRACDARNKITADPVEPDGPLMHYQHDLGPTPDEYLQVKVDSELISFVVDELDERSAAVIKLRFYLGMNSEEIAQVLGVSKKRLERIVTKAYRTVEMRLRLDNKGLSPWSRDQRNLFFKCLTKQATPEQRARAQQFIDADPACRAMVAQMRAALDRVAAVLPMPVFVERPTEHVVPFLDQLNQSGAALREALTTTASRAAAQAPAVEPATGGIATLTAAGAAKVVLVCLSLGGGAAVCIEVGVLGRDPKPENAPAIDYGWRPAAKEERAVAVLPKPPVQRAPVRKPTAAKPTTTPTAKPQTINDPPAPSPVPAGSEEFGPGSIGSVGRSTQPAAAPVDGGGEFTP